MSTTTAAPTFDGPEYALLQRGKRYDGLSEHGTRWTGVLAFVGPDTWGESDEPYAYFVDGALGITDDRPEGVPQGCFGGPLSAQVTDVLNARRTEVAS